MSYFISALTKHYADFNGRARRKEFWFFALFWYIGVILVTVVGGMLGVAAESGLTVGVVPVLYYVATIVPMIAVQIRRLHDVGKSGWFLLVSFIPIVGAIWILVLYCTDSQAGDNQYGPNPKQASA